MRVTRLYVPIQLCSTGSVEREAEETIKLMKWGLAEGLQPAQLTRIWLHTHPGDSAAPSSVDEDYWHQHATHGSVMGIMAKGGDVTARLAIRTDEFTLDLKIGVEYEEDQTYVEMAKNLITANVTDKWKVPQANCRTTTYGMMDWDKVYWNNQIRNWSEIDPATVNQKQIGESKRDYNDRMEKYARAQANAS